MPDSTEKKTTEDTIAAPNAEPLSPDAATPASSDQSAAEQGPSLQAQLEEAQAKVKAWEEEYLRARAEMENLRKRSAQEVLNAGKFAIEGFAEALLPVADSLEMALTLEQQTLEGLKGGVELTLKQLQQAFQKGRLTVIHPVGEKFDPNRHQAVSMVDGNAQNPPVPSNHVVQVMQKGYMVAERVLRPAIVVVAQ
ncbi:MAG: nucleotide exchange factor GrpE [Betaproteobacteria bacterium]|jgi:molecular chaperone GrpE|nr:nucleotide exchange factor GrpE [Betaproteobacteria bacterium]